MLCLKSDSKIEWVENALQNLDQILIDHAHCERKAATFALSMTTRYPEKVSMVSKMIEIAQEELEHFQLVHNYIVEKGIEFTKDSGNFFVQNLHSMISKQEPMRFLDSLLVGALIEARSCERFSQLAKHVQSGELQKFYSNLLASEAGHYTIYTDIAREYFPKETVKQRLEELAIKEAEIVDLLENTATIHG